MQTADWLVLTTGVASIAWLNWYFFASRPAAVEARVNSRGAQDITVVVRGGYSPSTINAKVGAPLRLLFDRQETSGCSEEVVIPAFNIRTFLPANAQTLVEITPPSAGTYEFTCGMGMLRGRIVAQ